MTGLTGLVSLTGDISPQLDAPVVGGAAGGGPGQVLLQSQLRDDEHVAGTSVVHLPLPDEAPQGPVHAGRVVLARLQAGEVRGQSLDDVRHIGVSPGLSEL